MANIEKEKLIISEIQAEIEYNTELDNESDSDFKYNGHIYTSDLLNIISKVMFGDNKVYYCNFGSKVNRTFLKPLTDNERTIVKTIAHRMIDKGIIQLSKSHKMVKLTK